MKLLLILLCTIFSAKLSANECKELYNEMLYVIHKAHYNLDNELEFDRQINKLVRLNAYMSKSCIYESPEYWSFSDKVVTMTNKIQSINFK